MEKEQIPEAVPGTAKELIEIAVDIYHRYKKSIFITETSYCGTVEERIAWMEELFEACYFMLEQGIELYGVTWFLFFWHDWLALSDEWITHWTKSIDIWALYFRKTTGRHAS